MCCIGRNFREGFTAYVAPWPRNSNLVTVGQGTFHHSSTLPAISMDFQKKKKQTKQLTPSPRSSSHDQPEGGATGPPHAQASSSQPIVNRFLGTMSINSCQSGHSLSQIINCITYYPSIPVLEMGALCNQPPRGNTIRRSEEVPRAIKLTKKTPQKIHEGKKIKIKIKINK